jgi:hypothetical protein
MLVAEYAEQSNDKQPDKLVTAKVSLEVNTGTNHLGFR